MNSNSVLGAYYKRVDAREELRLFFKKVPAPADDVKIHHSIGTGNEKAEMLYEIRPAS
jgi:hypothetical protein